MIFFALRRDVTLPANKYHGTARMYESRIVDVDPVFFLIHHRSNVCFQILVRSSVAQKRSQIMVVLAEQARPQFSVCRQPYTRTMPAKRLRHWRNQSDLSRRSVRKSILSRCLTFFMGNLH